MVSGLASSIRSATESATFDLAGHDASSIRSTVHDAFSQPFSLTEMIRITFIVGGGKLSRTKYDDKAMHAVTGVLKKLEFEEDRGASCILECAGCYKTQHDTGKNVFTVVVFPRVVDVDSAGNAGKNKTTGGEEYEPLIPINSPGYKMAVCSLQPTFHNLLSAYCPTYFEKKECLRCLEGLLEVERAIEGKMMVGNALDAGEQAFYDEASELKEKYAYAQKEASKHVEEGRLTPDEKSVLVEMNEKRIEALMNEKSSASVAEKLKKALARKQQLESLTDEVLSMHTSYPPALRHEAQINTLRKKLLPLRALEESARGRLLTLSETRSLTEKEEIEEKIVQLEMASCGWFEEEEAFQQRLHKSRDKFESKFGRSKKGGGKISMGAAGKSGGKGASAVNKWILPGEKPKSVWGSSSTGKGKLKGKGGAVFTAMMMDSSSDEEEESEDEEDESDDDEGVGFTVEKSYPIKKQHPASANVLSPKKAASPTKKGGEKVAPASDKSNTSSSAAEQSADTGSASKTKSKKNKKKKKKGKKSSSKQTQQEEAQEADVEEKEVETTETVVSRTDAPSTLSASLLDFWRSFLLPFIMAILDLIVSLVSSMFAGKSSKKGGKKKRG